MCENLDFFTFSVCHSSQSRLLKNLETISYLYNYSRPGLKPTIRPNLAILKTGIHCTSAGFLARFSVQTVKFYEKWGGIRTKFKGDTGPICEFRL